MQLRLLACALPLVLAACNSSPDAPMTFERTAPLKEGMKTITMSVEIDAPVATVWERMFSAEGYPQWTAPFGAGMYLEGDLAQGERMRFLGPGANGMLVEVEGLVEHHLIAFKHLGMVLAGKEDTTSAQVTSWAPAYEIYRFEATETGTLLSLDQDILASMEGGMNATYAKAFDALKALCEG